MSLYGALFSGVSGLQAQSSAMGAIADNVTNVNTNGYKSTKVQFQTLVTKQASQTSYSAGGVQAKPKAGIDVQGLLQSTTSATDVAISGEGFFIVNEAASPTSGDIYAYSRAGSFKVDKDGYLQNTAGFYMQGWPIQTWDNSTQAVTKTIGNDVYMKAYNNTNGDTVYINDNIVDSTNLRPLNLQTIGGTATATTTISMGANLPAADSIGSTHKTDVLIYDSLGGAHNINHTWTKRASNAWDLAVVPPAGANSIVVEDQTSNRQNYMALGRLDFNSVPDAGTSMSMTVGGTAYTINFTASTDDTVVTQDSLVIAAGATNGDTITIQLGGVSKVFEFDSDSPSSVTGTNIAVPISSSPASTTETASALASAIESTFDAAIGGGTWATVSGSTITINNTASGGAANDTYTLGSAAGTLSVNLNAGGVSGAVNAAPTDGSPTNENAAANTSLDVAVNSRSLSQVMDQLATTIQSILQYEFGGATTSPPAQWAERIAGENAVVFHNVDQTNAITMNAAAALTGTASAVIQNTSYTVEALTAATAWNVSGKYAVEFNGDGTPEKFFGSDQAALGASNPRAQYKIDWANGAEDMTGSTALSVGLGNYNVADGITQFGGNYQINFISQNGAAFGNFAGVSIGQDGVVTALFDNGVTKPVFMIPIATFTNPNGVESLTGNVWIETDFSGQPTVREAGAARAGSVNQSSLEASTVDLGEEFTSMITTQRAYSAAAKIISTSDEMLEELLRVK